MFTDNFNTAVTTNLADWPNWEHVDGPADFAKVSASVNRLLENAGADGTLLGASYRLPDQGSADHFSEFRLSSAAGNNGVVANRLTDRQNWIGIRCSTSQRLQILRRTTAGGVSVIATGVTPLTTNVFLRLSSVGIVHRAYINGALETFVGDADFVEDAAHGTVTRQGVVPRAGSFADWIDDLTVDAIGGAPSSALRQMMQHYYG